MQVRRFSLLYKRGRLLQLVCMQLCRSSAPLDKDICDMETHFLEELKWPENADVYVLLMQGESSGVVPSEINSPEDTETNPADTDVPAEANVAAVALDFLQKNMVLEVISSESVDLSTGVLRIC